MIYVKIIGGLGNQLFQYALAENLKKKNKLLLCKDFIKNYDLHNLSINNLKLNIKFSNYNQTKKFKIFKSTFLTTKIFMFSRKIFKLINFFLNKKYVYEEDVDTNKIVKDYRESYLFDGYWQNYNLVNNCKKSILKIFKIKLKQKHKKIINKINNSNSVAIHVRTYSLQGSKRAYLNLDLDYYFKAINFIKKKQNNTTFFIFSDSPSRAKKMFAGKFQTLLLIIPGVQKRSQGVSKVH